MKRTIQCALLAAVMTVASGCASSIPQGVIYTGVEFPVAVTASEGEPSKSGTSSCTSVLLMFATGDCSIDRAARNGGITQIHYVDWKASNFLGIYGTYTLTVYGD